MKTTVLFLSVLALMPVGAVSVDVTASGTPFRHYWSFGVGAGRVNEGLRAAWHEQLVRARKECGFRYVRMHDTFNDDMFVYLQDAKSGKVTLNFQYVDEVYDRMLAEGVRPFVELSFFPSALAKAGGARRQMWYRNCVEPDRAHYPEWGRLCEEFARHLVGRYGIEEIATWYFEVWNEPNLYHGFFHGTKSDYFELYRVSATALKRVDARLRVGGPATSNFIPDARHDGEIQDNTMSRFYPQATINRQQWKGVWIEEFLAWCARERLPVDFVSCHPYPTDYALDPESGRSKDAIRHVHSLRDDLDWLRAALARSAYPQAEIHLTEWSTSPNSRDPMHDRLPPCAYLAKAIFANLNKVDSLMYWTFSDIFEEKGGGGEIFHGSFGLLNFQGIPKPTYHAFRMFHQLGDVAICNADPVLVTRNSKTGKTAALIYAYPAEYESHVPSARDVAKMTQASATDVDLTLTGLAAGATFEIETLDFAHGDACSAWEAMGRPHAPTIAQTAALKARAEATLRELVRAAEDGTLTYKRTLAPWSLVLIREL
ncbi:MAG: glycoside hydrolase [Kiritimatiellia bacterium]